MAEGDEAAAAAAKAEADAAAARAKSEADAAKGSDTFSREYVESLRRKTAEAEKLVKEREAKLAEYEATQKKAADDEAAKRGEFEKLYQKEKAEREAEKAATAAKYKAKVVDAELKARASALGAHDPADVLALLDRSKISVSDDGDVGDTEALFSALKTSKPYLFKGATTEGTPKGGGTPAPSNQGSSSESKTDAFKLSTDAFGDAWAALGKRK
jgi:hypothetical protein